MSTKSNKEYFGNYMSSTYEPFINIFSDSCWTTKISLVIIKAIEVFTIIFVIMGCFLPRNLLLWHAAMCMLLIMCVDINYNPTQQYTLKMLKANGKANEYGSKELNIASETVPLHINTCKKILFIVMFLSVLGYLLPKYSLNNIIKSISNKSDDVNIADMNADDQNIITEFKMGGSRKVSASQTNVPEINEELFMDVDPKRIDNMDAPIQHNLPYVTNGPRIPIHASEIAQHLDGKKNELFKVDFEPIKFSLKPKKNN